MTDFRKKKKKTKLKHHECWRVGYRTALSHSFTHTSVVLTHPEMKNSWNKRVLVPWNIATFLSCSIRALNVQTVFSETLFPPQVGSGHLKARECNTDRDLHASARNGIGNARASFHRDVAGNERALRFHLLGRKEAVLCCHSTGCVETQQEQLIDCLRGNNVAGTFIHLFAVCFSCHWILQTLTHWPFKSAAAAAALGADLWPRPFVLCVGNNIRKIIDSITSWSRQHCASY